MKLEDVVQTTIKEGYHKAEAEIKSLLDQLTSKLKEFKDKIDIFDPQTLLKPVNEMFVKASAALEILNGRVLAKPLFAAFDDLTGIAHESVAGQPASAAGSAVCHAHGFCGQTRPGQWIAPLDDLYKQLQDLLKYTDVSPLMAELDARRAGPFRRYPQGDARRVWMRR